MPTHRHRHRWTVAAAALIAAGCSSNPMSPRLSDPAALTSDVQSVDSVFTTGVFQSFSAVSDSIGALAPPVRWGSALLGATAPLAPGSVGQAYAATPRQLQALKQVAAGLVNASATSVIPDTLWGSVFAWNTTTHRYYRQAISGGPATGVQFLLYAVDPVTQQVVESPLTQIGYVNLIDVSSGSTVGLQVVLVDIVPATPDTLANYTITATQAAAGSFTATAAGFVSDGKHTLTFNVSFAITGANTISPDLSLTLHWSLDNPAVVVDLAQTVTTSTDGNQATITINLTVTRGGETVAANGTITVQNTPQSISVNLAITLNGAAYARIAGTDAGITILHADGSQLSAAELLAVEGLFQLPADAGTVIEHLFHPCENFLHV